MCTDENNHYLYESERARGRHGRASVYAQARDRNRYGRARALDKYVVVFFSRERKALFSGIFSRARYFRDIFSGFLALSVCVCVCMCTDTNL